MSRESRDTEPGNGIRLRPGTPADSRACFDLFIESVIDLGRRFGVETITGGAEAIDTLWPKRQSLLQHLALTADQWWLAELDGQLSGYARSIVRDGVRQLTEFFVRPGRQSAGVGGAVLTRAFPAEGAGRRIILSSPDTRALVRYLKTGLSARFPIFHFQRARRDLTVEGIRVGRIGGSPEDLENLARIDREVIGFRRDQDHRWLLDQRLGYWYHQGDRLIGYGYLGGYTGPFAVLEPQAWGAILAHAEAASAGPTFGVEVPLINRAALDYLLNAGYQMDGFVNYFMSDAPIDTLERYLITAPSVFL